MKKNNIKYLLITILFLLFLIPYNNYLTYKELDIKTLFSKPIIINNNSNYKDIIFDNNYIDTYSKLENTEKNVLDYYYKKIDLKLPINNYDLLTLNIDTSNKIEEINLIVKVTADNHEYIYTYNNFLKVKNNNLLVINKKNVSDIEISATREIFNDYDEIAGIKMDEIKVNNSEDYHLIINTLINKNILLLLFVAVILITIVILKKLKKYDKTPSEKIAKKFLYLSIAFGIVFSILIPLYQIPDELTHINMIFDELNIDADFNKVVNEYGDTLRIMHQYDEKVNLESYLDFKKGVRIKEEMTIPKISIIKHFPQFIGIVIAKMFKLPVIILITLCELLAVLFYSYIGYKSIKLMPFKKEVFMFIMLLPICIQQMGSFSYDVMLLSMCYLFVSYLLYLKFTKSEINMLDIIKLILILALIALVKIPYGLLGLLIALLPLNKIKISILSKKIDFEVIKNNKRIIIIVSLITLLCVCILGIMILKKIYFGRILLAAIRYPSKSIKLVLKTFWLHKFYYVRGLTSEFGWLDTHSSILFSIYVIGMLMVTGFINFKRKNKKVEVLLQPFKTWEVVYIYIVTALLIFIISLSMIDWTAVIIGYTNLDKYTISELGNLIGTLPYIGGLQSRYYVPAVLLFFIPLFYSKITKQISKLNITILLYIYYIVLFVYLFILFLYRYWI